MKKILLCGMMLGLMTTVGFAQRGRSVGGVGPTATAPMAPTAPRAPMARTTPSAVPNAHGDIAPNSVSGSTHAKTVTPSATSTSPTAKTVTPNAGTVPDRVQLPDAQGASDHARTVGPNQ